MKFNTQKNYNKLYIQQINFRNQQNIFYHAGIWFIKKCNLLKIYIGLCEFFGFSSKIFKNHSTLANYITHKLQLFIRAL